MRLSGYHFLISFLKTFKVLFLNSLETIHFFFYKNTSLIFNKKLRTSQEQTETDIL